MVSRTAIPALDSTVHIYLKISTLLTPRGGIPQLMEFKKFQYSRECA